ncbi:MAG: hypothetical protein ABSG67_21605, partial [Thermoguttaceae bacterium]
MMLHKTQPLIIFVLLVVLASILKAQGPEGATGQQLLLLHNGQALEGRISRSDDVYRVVLPNGEIRVKPSDVELLCNDFEEAYQRKRAAIPMGSLRDHVDLAQWCQQHKLYDHAAAELAEAAAIAPDNPMVGFLQRRLRITLEPQPERPKAETAEDNSPPNDELDRMIRGLPQKAVENFTQSVQPLLMHNCTASGCHGPQSESGLRLQRTTLDQPAGRRMTQRNIYTVLRYVDRDNPLASRILTVPIAPHGTAKTAVFTEHQLMQYKRLVEWVLELGPADMPESPATIPNSQPIMAESFPDASTPATSPQILPKDARKARPLPSVAHSAAAGGMSGSARPGKPTTLPNREAAPATFIAPASKPVDAESSLDPECQAPKIKRGAAVPEFT